MYEPEPPGGVDRVTVAALAVTVVSVALGAWLGLCPPGAGTPQAQARGSSAAAQAKGSGGTAAPATPAVPPTSSAHAPSAGSPAGREAAPTGRKGTSAGPRTPMGRRGARRHQRAHRSAHDRPPGDRSSGRARDDRRLDEDLARVLGNDRPAGRGEDRADRRAPSRERTSPAGRVVTPSPRRQPSPAPRPRRTGGAAGDRDLHARGGTGRRRTPGAATGRPSTPGLPVRLDGAEEQEARRWCDENMSWDGFLWQSCHTYVDLGTTK
ncbi:MULTISPECIES: hypothetical protein [unclassified Nonomuraea]|uniref:hypothetical protein n=1 Tax=unclassified Nonomuraea TaxID=2593643 RepID=UPI0033F96AAE